MLVERDAAGEARVRVIDFGLARFMDADEPGTMQGLAHGTPGFMSPEQQRGDGAGIDTRTDVFSIGALMMTLVDAGAQSPRDLALIARTATQPDAADRYQTVDALADDLRRYLEHRPISARNPNPAYVVSRYAKRHPAQAVGGRGVRGAAGGVRRGGGRLVAARGEFRATGRSRQPRDAAGSLLAARQPHRSLRR